MDKQKIIGHIMVATGMTLPKFAAAHGLSKVAFYDLLNGRSKSKKLKALISEAIGIPESKIWPE